MPVPFKWSGPIPRLSQEGSDSCWGYPGPAAKAIAMENVFWSLLIIQKGRTALCIQPPEPLLWAGASRGQGREGCPRLLPPPPSKSHRCPSRPGPPKPRSAELWWRSTLLSHQAWPFRGLPPRSSPSPASCCSLWMIGCHQQRPAVSQHWMTATTANAPPEVLLLLGWVSFPLVIEPIVDTACCYWGDMATVLQREQSPWRRANQ